MTNCPRCGQPIQPGDAVDRQDGPHVYCLVPAIAVLPDGSFKRQGITLRKGQCVAFDENGNEVAWVVEGHPEFVISTIRGM
jgi:hypothetical protein